MGPVLNWKLPSTTLAFLACFAIVSTFLNACEDDDWESHQGKRPPITVVTPAAGPFEELHPFNKETFGKTRGFCPANMAEGNAVMIYLRELNPKSLAFLDQVESAMDANPKWNETFVHVFDKKGAQVGGYDTEELSARVDELKSLASERRWKKLSVGITANPSGDRVGLEKDNDLAVVLLTPNQSSKGRSVVTWHAISTLKETDSATFKGWLETMESQME